ncbi:hypothetical protein Q783_05045 [Carnobacterium inhibens subsp. gilichinskyi]|uniref:Uncharacterized protein n=1 Tax=Carnobacterium inhibens subsp. gilichinskyi TaxID=1266845 RepID=U5SC25_9LACT|nr:hypothetical protein Q783_05045 [Carnobacterium inhibens subsp. gilichinskyi]
MPYSGEFKEFGSLFKEPVFLKPFKWPREKCAQNSWMRQKNSLALKIDKNILISINRSEIEK